MKFNIDDTFAETFEGIYSRIIVTADHRKVLEKISHHATATPSIVIGRLEGGLEKRLTKIETPDGREGIILQFWGGIDENKPFNESLEKFEKELSFRIRQDILVKPFTAVFDYVSNPVGSISTIERVGHCGDGFEWNEKRYGREVIIIPLMVSNFLIENKLGFAKGIMGANFWIMCQTKKAVMEAGYKALDAINQVMGVITPFGICSAGSKPETNFPLIGPTTNHPYCASLKEQLGDDSHLPKGVKYIPEIVINGISMEVVKKAMKKGIESIADVEGIERISAGNYNGKLGKAKIYLKELF